MGQGGDNAETRNSSNGRNRGVSGDLESEDQRQNVFSMLSADDDDSTDRGGKRRADDEGDGDDVPASVSRRLDEAGGLTHAGSGQNCTSC